MSLRGLLFLLCTCLISLRPFAHTGLPATQSRTTFIENKGQWSAEVRFQLRAPHMLMNIENNAFHYVFYNPEDLATRSKLFHQGLAERTKTFSIRGHVLRMEFEGALKTAVCKGENAYSHYYNYYLGKDQTRWQSGVKPYRSVQISQLYRGIYLKLYGEANGKIKYDLMVSPGASPEAIKLHYKGAEQITQTAGALQIKTSVNTLTESKPYAYQLIDGKEVEVACSYKILPNHTITFELGEYRKDYELVIDPQLIFSTYSGSTADNFGAAATYDNDGNLYTAGITDAFSGDYPVTPGAFQQLFGGGSGSFPQTSFPCDITISKYNNDGTQLLYATYLGGSHQDYAHSLVTDKHNRLIVYGSTLSADFPVSSGAFDTVYNGSFDIVLTKFNALGTAIIGSTFVGGNASDGLSITDTLCMNYMDQMRGEVQSDSAGFIIVGTVTKSANFPVTVNAFQKQIKGAQDGCVFKMDSTLRNMVWGTYLGDTLNETLNSIEVMSDGSIYAVGGTHSQNMPVSSGAYGGSYHGGIADGYIAKINSSGSSLLRFMYWGGPGYDQCYFVKANSAGDIFVLGQNFDTIPVTAGTYRNTQGSLFVSGFNNNLTSLLLSTRIGNGTINNVLSPSAFMIDVCGNIYASVWGGLTNRANNSGASRLLLPSNTFNFPVTPDAFQPTTDNEDFYLFVLTPDADTLLYATYFGENGSGDHVDGGTSRFDRRGIVYQSVCASCNTGPGGNFPTTPNAYSPTNVSPRCSNAGFKLDFRKNNTVVADFDLTPRHSCGDSVITFTNKSYNARHYRWILNGVLKSTSQHFTDTIRNQGIYQMKLIVIDSSRCIIIDSITKSFERGVLSNASFTWKRDSCSARVFFTNTSTTQNPTPVPILWQFGDGDTSTTNNPTHIFPASGTYQVKLIVNMGSSCADTAVQTIVYDKNKHHVVADFIPIDTMRCEPALLELRYTGINGQSYKWYKDDTLFTQAKDTDIVIMDKGIYRIKLVVTDTSVLCNKSDSITRTFRLYPEVYPLFSSERDSCSFTVKFTNNTAFSPADSISFRWYFGDGDSSSLVNPVHSYPYGGLFNVKLVANTNIPCERNLQRQIKLDTLPSVLQANFTMQPSPTCLPATVTFTNTSVNGIKRWWFKNGVLKDSTNNSWTDTFNVKQTVQIKLVVFDTLTCTPFDTIEKALQVLPAGISQFKIVRDTCSPAVFFINQSTSNHAGDALTYEWDLGDGTKSVARDPVHAYAFNGSYKVSLIVFPGTPCADTSEQTIVYDSIAHLLDASFTLNDTVFCLPALISTTNTSLNAKKKQWFINNVLLTDSTNFTHTINEKGTYEIKLVVSDSLTCLQHDTAIQNIVIENNAIADFEIARDSCSLDVVFINKSAVLGATLGGYVWYFGDGDTSTQNNPTHTYKRTDYYTIRLISNPGTVCADTAEKTYYIDGDSTLEVKIPNVFTPNNDGLNDCYHISGLTKCDELELKIYNRWGQLQFETTGYKDCWGGRNLLGKEVTEGVYFYIVKIRKKDGNQINQHGTITLIRQ